MPVSYWSNPHTPPSAVALAHEQLCLQAVQVQLSQDKFMLRNTFWWNTLKKHWRGGWKGGGRLSEAHRWSCRTRRLSPTEALRNNRNAGVESVQIDASLTESSRNRSAELEVIATWPSLWFTLKDEWATLLSVNDIYHPAWWKTRL